MPVQFHPVKSSNIAAVSYDPATKELHVKFGNGAVHAYAGVEGAAHANFMQSVSKGSHFAKHIKGKFESRKVSS